MKVIDLYVKIANNEEVPKKIKYKNIIFSIRKEKDDYVSKNGSWFSECFCFLELNDEVEIIEDIPKDNKKIEDKARFQYSEIPNWFDIKEVIRVVNSNFERHQKALSEIIDKINGE